MATKLSTYLSITHRHVHIGVKRHRPTGTAASAGELSRAHAASDARHNTLRVQTRVKRGLESGVF